MTFAVSGLLASLVVLPPESCATDWSAQNRDQRESESDEREPRGREPSLRRFGGSTRRAELRGISSFRLVSA